MSEYTISFSQEPEPQQSAGASCLGWLWEMTLGLGFGVAATIVGGAVWGLLAYFTNTVFFLIPIVVGFAVASSLFFPFKKKNFLLAVAAFVPCVVLTVASAALGEYIFYTLAYAREVRASLPDAAITVAVSFVAIVTETREALGMMALAALGALVGFGNAVRN